MDHDVTNLVFSNGARLLNFSLKILVIKLSAKLSGLSISLTRWIKVFLLRVIKVFYMSRDLLFLISLSLLHLGIHAGLFHNIQAMRKTRGCLRIFASLSFPFPHFNLKTLNVTDHLQVTYCLGHRAKTAGQVSWRLIKTIRFKCYFAKLCKLWSDPCLNIPEYSPQCHYYKSSVVF